ncbi:DUF58 domain-containing protein [Jannaschia sp. R86511]|uniref:DUF58 domain-containing protein n=1 Tax=Jannaschia sp. R86511 TaxID=3093853 RepID=UPI0036D2DA63
MTPAGPGWRLSPAYRRALGLGAGGLAVGAATGVVELALLAVPLALAAALAAGPRPGPGGLLTRVHAAPSAAVGEPLPVTVELTAASAEAGAELVVLRLPRSVAAGAVRPSGSAVAVQARRRGLRSTTVPTTWGRRTVARPDALCVAHDGLLVAGPVEGAVRELLVVPGTTRTGAGPLPPRPTPTVGRHPTRRTGEGGELYAVDELRPGDRLRHVDWRATARRGPGPTGPRLHVRRSVEEAEGQVVLLLDTRADLERDVSTWSLPRPLDGGALAAGSSLDAVVSTACALAAAHLEAGDRVSTVDLTVPGAAVRPGSGRRHLRRLRTALAATSATGTPVLPRAARGPRPVVPRRLLAQVPARALVVVLSPFVDDDVTGLALALHRHGRSTLGVDCLPPDLVPGPAGGLDEAAVGLVLAERRQRLQVLRAAGVDVLPAGTGVAAATAHLVRARRRGGR